jgi:hypothetical protein
MKTQWLAEDAIASTKTQVIENMEVKRSNINLAKKKAR